MRFDGLPAAAPDSTRPSTRPVRVTARFPFVFIGDGVGLNDAERKEWKTVYTDGERETSIFRGRRGNQNTSERFPGFCRMSFMKLV